MTEFVLKFNLTPLNELDRFALLACQSYNFGNDSDWFGSFRGGIYAFSNRIHAVRRHFYEVHAWIPTPRHIADSEYHLTSIFFNMDSSLECLTYGINALGNAIDPRLFRNVTDSQAIRLVSPVDILGSKRPPLKGYEKYFPQFQSLWQSRMSLVEEIQDQHDVSKHRQTIFIGGKSRIDAPSGFFEALGIHNNKEAQFAFLPMEEIILNPNPKAPNIARKTISNQRLLEDLCIDFVELVNESSRLAYEDARSTIPLRHLEFIK